MYGSFGKASQNYPPGVVYYVDGWPNVYDPSLPPGTHEAVSDGSGGWVFHNGPGYDPEVIAQHVARNIVVEQRVPTGPVAVTPDMSFTPGYIEGLELAGVEVTGTPALGPGARPTISQPAFPVTDNVVPVTPSQSGAQSLPVIQSPAAQDVNYYNVEGKPFDPTRDTVSYWQTADGQWYQGSAGGAIIPIKSPPFSTSGGLGGSILPLALVGGGLLKGGTTGLLIAAVGGFLLLRGQGAV